MLKAIISIQMNMEILYTLTCTKVGRLIPNFQVFWQKNVSIFELH